MFPSSTVENYLKAIYQGQATLTGGERLVSMGHVASALGVTPGTATTMVKTMARHRRCSHLSIKRGSAISSTCLRTRFTSKI